MKIKSNIELFRIVLFLMVVSIHVTSVGLVLATGGFVSGSLAWYYASLMRLLVAPAVIGFVLISGYLIVNKEFDVRKYLKKLGTPFLIYFPVLFLFDYSIVNGDIFKKVVLIYGDLLGMIGTFYHLWYIVVLAVLALFIPFINKLLSYCSKKQHLSLSLLLIFVSTINITSALFLKKQLFGGLVGVDARIFLFVSLYVVGAYFGKYGVKIKKKFSILGYILIPLSVFLYYVLSTGKTVLSYVELSYLFIVLQGIFLFLFFIKLEFNSRIINYIGSLVYGGYVIHVFFISFLQKFLPFTTFFDSKYYFLVDLSFIFLVVGGSLVVEMLRVKLFKFFVPVVVSVVGVIRQKYKKDKLIEKSVF